MTEHDASPRQNLQPRPHDHRNNSQDRHVAPGSPETGESSTSGSLMNATWTTDATLAQRLSRDESPANGHANELLRGDVTREIKRRPHKPRHSGAFLLSDPFEEAIVDEARGRKYRPKRTADKGKGASSRHSNEQAYSRRQSGLGMASSTSSARMSNRSSERPPGTPPRGSGDNTRQEHLQVSPRYPSPRSSTSSMDMDSTQIVSMALNLSESRRLAQRRHVSQPVPPRLAPLSTDDAVAGSLRYQLQQQRRVSRTVSPKPERGTMQRLGSSGRTASPLQPPFDPMTADSGFKYRFSHSTLARVQKVKDYMELLAQYRRLLELLPPLQPNRLSKASTLSNQMSSAGSMPMNLNSIDTTGQIGRPYDPLQYIRNRKVRARERMTIDGESQGFGDVKRVTDWVDEVAKWVATRQMRTPGSPSLPPFPGADVYSVDTSIPSHMPRPSISITKPKRPRNDWILDPADVLADVYWLEQDGHKRLVEDPNGRRVFPQDSELYRPLSRATDDAPPGAASTPAGQLLVSGSEDAPGKVSKTESDHVSASTRERARKKLQELRGFHRQTGAIQGNGQSLLRRRDSSSSSSSSSDSGSQKKRGRKGTFGGTEKDILEKQMAEMIAREAREMETKSSQDSESTKQLKSRPSNIIITSDHRGNSDSSGGSRQHSRRESRVDLSDVDVKDQVSRYRTGSPQRPGRESLEVPPFRTRMSIESDSPPNSPGFRTSLSDHYFTGSGADGSPSPSMPGSPSRNPFSKVKQIFRDRSRERALERHREAVSSEKEDGAGGTIKAAKRMSSNPELQQSREQSRSRPGSIGPEPKLTLRLTGDSHRSRHKSNNMRLGDSSSGLRGLFKGPRIDSVLKSSVSKVSELLWKKESEAEDSEPSNPSSDDSDTEDRGRSKEIKALASTPSVGGRPGHVKQGSKHFLDVMPPFVSTSDGKDDISRHGSIGVPLATTTSHRSTRFELLKPPRINISAADSSTNTQKGQITEISDAESDVESVDERQGIGKRRPSIGLSVGPPNTRLSPGWGRDGHHFATSGQSMTPERATLSKREIARLRALMLSSGVLAMEISRRAHRAQTIDPARPNDKNDVLSTLGNSISWPEVTQLAPEEQRRELLCQPISQADLFLVTANVLGTSIQSSCLRWESAAEQYKYRTRTDIDTQIERLRTRVQLELSAMTRAAGEEADEFSGDLVDGQRRKVKSVVDVIDKLSRRRRRRFRWVRRAGWLALEWLLVGFMWYVWFVVMIARVFLGIGKGFLRGVKWLLWL